MKELNVSAVKM